MSLVHECVRFPKTSAEVKAWLPWLNAALGRLLGTIHQEEAR